MLDLLALITIIFWPVIPLFWIPVHGLSRVFKKLGLFTYIMPIIPWLPLAYVIFINRDFIHHFKVDLPIIINITGISLLAMGALLHTWTGKLLGPWGLIGLPEVSHRIRGNLVTNGPFAVVRHPTYFAHTLMFSGVFLMTGVITVAIITFLDLLLIHLLIIPLEEKELLGRFGKEYNIYKARVPRFFPRISFFNSKKRV